MATAKKAYRQKKRYLFFLIKQNIDKTELNKKIEEKSLFLFGAIEAAEMNVKLVLKNEKYGAISFNNKYTKKALALISLSGFLEPVKITGTIKKGKEVFK